MKRPYLLLLAGTLVLAFALTMLGRPRPAATPPPTTTVAPVTEVTIVIAGGHLSPAASGAPKGHIVRLRVEHRGEATARLALAGYEDRLEIPPLAPGTVWTGEFLADRPGDDFAWLLDDRPAGRFAVTGSHLVEGHR